MEILVKYFASVRERFGRSEDCTEVDNEITVGEIWQRISDGELLPVNILVAINMEYAEPFEQVKDGDEVAFFLPVTGG